MERRDDSHLGKYGWLGLACFVAAWDMYAPQSLTSAFREAATSEHYLIRAAALGGLAVTAAHLLDVLPHEYDPFYLAIEQVRPER